MALNPEEKSRLLGAIFNEQAIRGFEFALKRGGDSIDSSFSEGQAECRLCRHSGRYAVDNTSGAFTKWQLPFRRCYKPVARRLGHLRKQFLKGGQSYSIITIVPASAMLGTMFDGIADGSAWRRF